jgi:hypothetical protein
MSAALSDLHVEIQPPSAVWLLRDAVSALLDGYSAVARLLNEQQVPEDVQDELLGRLRAAADEARFALTAG